MRIFLTAAMAMATISSIAFAKDVYVKGYVRKDGSYVPPHHRSSPNSTKADNYSTYGNINPYTGKEGTKTYDNNDNNNNADGSQDQE